ncbi:hypothetical protein MRB53_001442 [Persea americana]|uniref:Uncharacterized protein n=1 Tax=Persea americana TaxID=3435 RepID=A0ACC2MSQ2_PERAE|nr:hypothetical protein MRB53_001442 [Persea americana]
MSSLSSSPLPLLLLLFLSLLSSSFCLGHEPENPASCPFSSHGSPHHDHHHEHHHHDHHHGHVESRSRSKLPEELAEEDDLGRLEFFDSRRPLLSEVLPLDLGDRELSKLGLWIHAMGCSLLVSMCSLICLTLLPVILLQGKPSKTLVDSLAAFGAGAMLGDAFLHQLPHAFGGGHLHPHDHHSDLVHDHDQVHHHGHSQSHSHTLKDLSVGLSILSGIVLFLLVEKVVRYVEELSGRGAHALGHGHHHHHHHKSGNKLKDDDLGSDDPNAPLTKTENGSASEMASDTLDGVSDDCLNNEKHSQETVLRKRSTSTATTDDNKNAAIVSTTKPGTEKERGPSPSSLVFGYLNLFSDGVHNFTDGMALGSAFLLYGSVGGWSRTLFLLAHELPQEVGDFGILVRSGFSVSKALFFNFLSALVALAGTALALILGQDPGQSSLIEGFTAGGFIYIAVAGVLPEMNSGNTTFKSTLIQLTSLILGITVALCISLVE